jgi:hypothetical protein
MLDDQSSSLGKGKTFIRHHLWDPPNGYWGGGESFSGTKWSEHDAERSPLRLRMRGALPSLPAQSSMA